MTSRKASGLSRSDWIEAGLAVLQNRGYCALRVDRLSQALGVTKGSFYYHFENKEDFEAALLDTYVEQMTVNMARQISMLGDPAARLRKTLELHITDAPGYSLAFRAWGLVNERVAEALASIDRFRLHHLTTQFLDLGFSPLAAETRARVLVTFLYGEMGLFSQIEQAERIEQLEERCKLFLGGAGAGGSDQKHDGDPAEGEPEPGHLAAADGFTQHQPRQ